MKYKLKDLKMNRTTLLSACAFAALGLSGCVNTEATAPQNDTISYNTPTVCEGGMCENDPFVNYTQTRAKYREYGELSPRDELVSQAGAGNNLSASIPPSIENEVIKYEEQVVAEKPAEDVVQPIATVENTDSQTKPEEVVATENASNASDESAETPETVETVVEEVTEVQGDDDGSYDYQDPVQDWYAEEGQNLKALLTQWSEQSGWRLVWNTNRNYVLNAGAMFRGRFADVSSALIRAFARARPAPIATFYKGNRVLVVETMEDENAYD